MTFVIVTPRDPLIARDGRSFGAGQNMYSLDWILPSVFAGSLRTFLGKQNQTTFDEKLIDILHNTGFRGPFPFYNNEIYFPKPADYIVKEDENDNEKGTVYSARPLKELTDDDGMNLPVGLMPAMLPKDVDEDFKPKKTPAFWSWKKMNRWLQQEVVVSEGELYDEGDTLQLPEKDERIHVAIDPESGASEDSKLFSTTGLDFNFKDKNNESQQLQIIAEISEYQDPKSRADKEHVKKILRKLDELDALYPLGGERRLAHWRTVSRNGIFPAASDWLRSVKEGDKIRMALVTPARFNNGWRPGWYNCKKDLRTIPNTDVQVELKGAIVERWLPISGWSYQNNTPKATRRLAPAGSVYFFEVVKGGDLSKAWLQSVGDREGEDGLGLALFGKWNYHSQS
ncbi:MAG: type III-B CRISPR module-associated protein Cmr3 [Planctomycetaceae bacterium]|jgi:CRISPR-associated protein Cmr3|nr:type III-B CRISPR module-associated protein Cmr3 [Planctomycetaceae bacterium]